jgi:putative OmpL-like beta-barrel porin-2
MNALAVLALLAQTPANTVHVGGFVDTYIAWDFSRPHSFDRSYTTQPARHSEFNVNLAFLEARVDGPRVRGRLALQAGTSVQSNYAGEPRIGAVSGPEVSRFLQEATVGVRVARPVWVDAGVFFSHIGQESWISRDNPVYSRSLIADYTPYYSAGVRGVWQATSRLTVQLHIINGWQIISENNEAKSAGLRIEYAPSTTLLLGYANFVGNELPDSVPAQTRVFNQAFARIGAPAPTGTAAWVTVDYGTQDGNNWYGFALVARHPFSARVAVNGRLERYADPHQVIVASLGSGGFEASGASLGLDVTTPGGVVWRTELRGFRGDRALFPQRAGGLGPNSGFLVTSFALSL